jgi:16S rRNA (guanine527-N7)-methyltransferase
VNSREFRQRLQRRARRAGVTIGAELSTQLEVYYRLLATWNRKINLTSLNLVDAADEAFDRLLIEPIVAARHVPIESRRLIDIGSGGGSPAIPLRLAAPQLHLLMVESKTRKSVFLREALRSLDLANADVATARFEELLARPDLHESHDLVTIRAVRVETRVLMGLQAFVKPGGLLFLFRGSSATDPVETIAPPLTWRATYPLVESLRSRLVVLEKRRLGQGEPTPSKALPLIVL